MRNVVRISMFEHNAICGRHFRAAINGRRSRWYTAETETFHSFSGSLSHFCPLSKREKESSNVLLPNRRLINIHEVADTWPDWRAPAQLRRTMEKMVAATVDLISSGDVLMDVQLHLEYVFNFFKM